MGSFPRSTRRCSERRRLVAMYIEILLCRIFPTTTTAAPGVQELCIWCLAGTARYSECGVALSISILCYMGGTRRRMRCASCAYPQIKVSLCAEPMCKRHRPNHGRAAVHRRFDAPLLFDSVDVRVALAAYLTKSCKKYAVNRVLDAALSCRLCEAR